MGPDRHPFEKSDGATAPEAAPVASGAGAAADPEDAFTPTDGEDAGARLTDEEQESPLAGTAEVEHERKVELDLEELVAKAERADEYLELARRTKADFENYRKRAAREAAAAQERGVSKLARELLPAIDNLERALAAAGGEASDDDGAAHTLSSGIKLVLSELVAALARVGIEGFSPEGEPFDPQRHEAMAQHPVPGTEPGTVVEVYQRGYALGEAVLRPARVVVAG